MNEEILSILKEINQKLDARNEIKILYVDDVARILGINRNTATKLLKSDDINSIKNCRKIKNWARWTIEMDTKWKKR